jgi:recombination protein RecT
MAKVNTADIKNQMKQQQQGSGQQPAQVSPSKPIADYLEKMAPAIEKVLPKHMTPERMARIALSEIRKNPTLLQCEVSSLGAAVMQCATLGLEPGILGHVHFVPFWNKNQNRRDVQFIIGYKGYIDLARRSGELLSIMAMEVCEEDFFDYAYGITERLEHVPAMSKRGDVTRYYAYAKFKDGGHAFLVRSKEEILEHAFKHSKQIKDGRLTGPWKDHFNSMAKKTMIRELIKYMPLSIETQEKFNSDEQVMKGINKDDQDNIFDMEMPSLPDQEDQQQENKEA